MNLSLGWPSRSHVPSSVEWPPRAVRLEPVRSTLVPSTRRSSAVQPLNMLARLAAVEEPMFQLEMLMVVTAEQPMSTSEKLVQNWVSRPEPSKVRRLV